MADIKKIKVDGTTYDIRDDTKLPKVTYEWNREFAAGSNGAISLGRYNIYDSQLTFDITSTTNQSLSGKLVIATQNGTIHQAKVFGDASGTLASKLIIYQSAISNSRSWVEVFCNFNGWSKNKVHIYAIALNSATVQKQMTSVTISNGVPAAANVTSGDTKWTGAIVNDFSHSHGISIATSSGTNQLTLAHGTKYALTAGGQSFIFTTPNDNNTHNSHAIISGTKSDGSTQIKGSASSGDITLGDSGVTAGAYGDTAAQTPGYNATFKVPSISVNAKGIVTAIGEHTVKIPASDNTNTSHSHSAGVGLVGSGSAGTSGTYTYKAKLRNETALTVDSAAATTTSGRVYPVAIDKSSYLSVNVPWTDTKNTTGSTDSTEKLYLVGAKTQAANPQTYSNSKLYVEGDILTTETLKAGTIVTNNWDFHIEGSDHDIALFSSTTDGWTSENLSGHLIVSGDDDNSNSLKPTNNTGWDDLDTYYFNTGITLAKAGGNTSHKLSFPAKSGTFALTSDIKSLASNTTASGGIKYITEASFTNGVLTLESKYLHLE